jgi:phage shock protein PspC (stress-responsive transcriptional regulator)
MEKRLYRLRDNRMLGGVCTGLGEYFNLDPVLIRIVFIILALQGGAGVIAYIVLWIVVPYKELPAAAAATAEGAEVPDADALEMESVEDTDTTAAEARREKRHLYGGVVLIALGLLFLMDNFMPSFGFEDFWPLILVAIGGSMLYNSYPQHKNEVAS